MSAEATILTQLGHLQGAISDIASDLGDVKGDVGEVKATGEATLKQAEKTNGRVTAAEKRLDRLERRQEIEDHDDKTGKEAETLRADAKHRRREYLLGSAAVLGTILGGVLGDIGHHFGWW